MCQSRADGGRRCYAHQFLRVDKLEEEYTAASPDSPEAADLAQRLEVARRELRQTRTGLQQHIAQTMAPGKPYDADELTSTINAYVAGEPSGRSLTLPGGRYRVLAAHTSHGHTILEVAGATSAQSLSRSVTDRYNANAFGKQVARVSAAELRRDFPTMLVLADGSAGAAVRASGEISAVFSDGTSRGTARALIPIAVQHGGTYLECFDTYLPRIYRASGFIPVASIPFDREFAPTGWDYKAMENIAPPRGEPDITFMVTPKQHAKLGYPEPQRFQSYDEADQYTRTGQMS